MGIFLFICITERVATLFVFRIADLRNQALPQGDGTTATPVPGVLFLNSPFSQSHLNLGHYLYGLLV